MRWLIIHLTRNFTGWLCYRMFVHISKKSHVCFHCPVLLINKNVYWFNEFYDRFTTWSPERFSLMGAIGGLWNMKFNCKIRIESGSFAYWKRGYKDFSCFLFYSFLRYNKTLYFLNFRSKIFLHNAMLAEWYKVKN